MSILYFKRNITDYRGEPLENESFQLHTEGLPGLYLSVAVNYYMDVHVTSIAGVATSLSEVC